MTRKGTGRRTRQYNPGAKSLGAYVAAAVKHKRGAHDAGGKVIHETPKHKRSEYARKIWAARRRFGNPPSKHKWIDRDGKSQLVEVEEEQLGQFGDVEGARSAADFHRSEFDATTVRKSPVYGWLALGITYGKTIREVGNPVKKPYAVIYRTTGETLSEHSTRGQAEKAADKVSPSIRRYVGVEYLGPWENPIYTPNDSAFTAVLHPDDRHMISSDRRYHVYEAIPGDPYHRLLGTYVLRSHGLARAGRGIGPQTIAASGVRFEKQQGSSKNPRPVVFYGPTAEARKAHAEIRKDGISGVLHAPSRGYQVLSVAGERDAAESKNVLRRKGFETKLGHIPNPLLEAIVGGAAAGAAVVGSQVAIKKLQKRKGKGMWPFRRSNQNNGTKAEQLYRSFHGRDPREVLTMSEAIMRAGTYVALGDNPEIWLRPVTGKDPDGWDQADITFDPSDEIKAAVNESGSQLFFVGKNQRLPGEFLDVLARQGADLGKRFLNIGEVHALSYQTEKKFDGFADLAYAHKLGVDGGKRPILVYDQETQKLLWVGGVYSIAPYDSRLEASPGIVN